MKYSANRDYNLVLTCLFSKYHCFLNITLLKFVCPIKITVSKNDSFKYMCLHLRNCCFFGVGYLPKMLSFNHSEYVIFFCNIQLLIYYANYTYRLYQC